MQIYYVLMQTPAYFGNDTIVVVVTCINSRYGLMKCYDESVSKISTIVRHIVIIYELITLKKKCSHNCNYFKN